MNPSLDTSVQTPAEKTAHQPVLPLPVPLPVTEEVLQAIRADCLMAPDEYLEEVLVPFGGE
jgi:hypothetical protein